MVHERYCILFYSSLSSFVILRKGLKRDNGRIKLHQTIQFQPILPCVEYVSSTTDMMTSPLWAGP